MDNQKINDLKNHKLAIKKYKSQCLAIVESVLLTDASINRDEFLKNCEFIDKNVYDDIVTERSILMICGYALCNNKLNLTEFRKSQRFHISLKTSNVYDISERKMFCSDLCYNASNYLKEQIDFNPIYLRNSTVRNTPIVAYDGSEGIKGNVIPLRDYVTSDENDYIVPKHEHLIRCKQNTNTKKSSKITIGFPYIEEEQLNQLKGQMEALIIKEKTISHEINREMNTFGNESND